MKKDPLVVPTEQLGAVVREYISKHNGRFPRHTGGNDSLSEQTTQNYSYSAYSYIILNSSVTLNERTLWRIVAGESKHTQFYLADAILCAIEEQAALIDGRIEVLPNPQYGEQAWLSWKASQ